MHAINWPEVPTFGDLVALRRWATNEPYQSAKRELAENAELIPQSTRDQARAEAAVFSALITGYGFHWLSHTGGPFGIQWLTPRHDELVLHVGRDQLPRWASSLIPTPAPGTEPTGVPGLRWSREGKDTVLTLAGGRIVLARTFERDWNKAIAAAVAQAERQGRTAQPTHAAVVETADRHHHRTHPLATQLSATLRRIGLLGSLKGMETVDLLIHEHLGASYLIDRALPSPAPLWLSAAAPFPLWPTAGAEHAGRPDPQAAVLRLVSEFSTGAAAPRDPAHALCLLIGYPAEPLALAVADLALAAAKKILADPASAALRAGGGWIARCLWWTDVPVAHANLAHPLGADELFDTCHRAGVDLEALGRLSPDFAHPEAQPDSEEASREGRDAVREMVDWALAAATVPDRRPDWTRDSRSGAWTAQIDIPAVSGRVALTVESDSETSSSYTVFAEAPRLPLGTFTAKGSFTQHPAACVLVAEYEAITAAIPRWDEEVDGERFRLVAPQSVAPDADPTLADLILAAPKSRVIGIDTLPATLDFIRYRVGETTGASKGHWLPEPADGPDHHCINSYTSLFMAYGGIPATTSAEDANTATVDTPTFRRHLAAHRAALDPFVTCYLAAADAEPRSLDIGERHRAGVRALRTADLPALLALDPRHLPDSVLKTVEALPEDLYDPEWRQ
ncbi:hypothetical protein ACGF12_14010 [Kitasatospora sp. NPDC048296]|uniref:hypothetical protein n=1 Tax=Kitasatospora sp. NPDC048296 TaxID=3364048 RepID=UPI0037150DE2